MAEIQKPLGIMRPSLIIQHDGLEATLLMDDADPAPISLNEIHRFFGSPKNKEPREWVSREDGKEAIAAVAKSLNVPKKHIWKSRRGKHLGGTWAHWKVAIAYIMFLSPDAKVAVIEGWHEHVREKVDPALKMQRAVESFRQLGKDELWIMGRMEGIAVRTFFTACLQAQDVKGIGYALCTDAINKPILGGTAKECKSALGLREHDRLRNHLELYQLSALRFAEDMAAKVIKDKNIRGNEPCHDVCADSGRFVGEAMVRMGLE